MKKKKTVSIKSHERGGDKILRLERQIVEVAAGVCKALCNEFQHAACFFSVVPCRRCLSFARDAVHKISEKTTKGNR